MECSGEMEIEFELEDSDLVFTFEPWSVRNHSSRAVQWQVPHGPHTRVVANLFGDLSVQTTRNRSDESLDNL